VNLFFLSEFLLIHFGTCKVFFSKHLWGEGGGPSSAFLTRVGLREIKLKYIFVYFSLLEILLTGGHYLDFNVSTDKVLSKSTFLFKTSFIRSHIRYRVKTSIIRSHIRYRVKTSIHIHLIPTIL
jgi:hypothetical protein